MYMYIVLIYLGGKKSFDSSELFSHAIIYH